MALIHGISHLLNKLLLLIICCIMLLTGCTQSDLNYTDVSNTTDSKSAINHSINSEFEGENYRIYTGDQPENHFYYYFELLDSSGNVLLNQCTYMSQPVIQKITDNIIKVSAQPGTGRGSRWTFYYNLESKVQSSSHFYVLCEKSTLIAYFNGQQIIVSDMFNSQKNCKIISLTKELSTTTDPIESAEISDDLKTITITYFTGLDFNETSEVFEL